MIKEICPITDVQIFLTNQCQLRCKYCFEEHDDRQIDLETTIATIDYIANNAKENDRCPRISFFGGEPLLCYENIMVPAIEYIRSNYKQFDISFVTNGLLLDEEKLQFFKQNRVNFMLSIDGNEQGQNANRLYKDGRSSFSDIEKNIPIILKYFPMTEARMTVAPNNIQYMYDSIKYLQDAGFVVLHIVPDVFSTWTDEDYTIMQEQFNLIKDYIIETFENEDIPLVPLTLSQMFPKIVINQYEIEHDRYRQTPSVLACNRCGIGMLGSAKVNVDGELFSCDHCSMKVSDNEIMHIGNIKDGLDEEAVRRLLSMNSAEPMHSNVFNCKECPLDRVCSGGCAPNNYLINGNFNVAPESYCQWTRMMYECAEEIVTYFDDRKTNELFKDFFYGKVAGGVCAVY